MTPPQGSYRECKHKTMYDNHQKYNYKIISKISGGTVLSIAPTSTVVPSKGLLAILSSIMVLRCRAITSDVWTLKAIPNVIPPNSAAVVFTIDIFF